MPADPEVSLPPLKISTRLSESGPKHWLVRVTAKYDNVDYSAEQRVLKVIYLPTLPTVMGVLVREVAHQIVAAAVGQRNAQDGRH